MKVLLIVDMQKGFMKNYKYKNLNKKINKLISTDIYDKIIFTKFINNESKNKLFQTKLNWHNFRTEEEQSISLEVPDNALIFEKYGYGLQDEDLKYIKSLNIKEIDICGIKAEACIYAISLQLWDKEIYPNLLPEYILGNQNMQKIYKHQFALNNKSLK